MSEKWQLNMMSIAMAFGIVLTWITWDPQVVILTMVLCVLRLGTLFYEYPELTGRPSTTEGRWVSEEET